MGGGKHLSRDLLEQQAELMGPLRLGIGDEGGNAQKADCRAQRKSEVCELRA